MGRPVASNVSVFSDCVAKSHQALQHVSSSPSKIPYGGFSPVRLQAGCQPRPSPTGEGLSARPTYARLRATYTEPQPAVPREGTPARTGATTVIEPTLKRHSPPLPPARPPRGPWLARGFCSPAGSSLTMASSEPLPPLRRLIAFVRTAPARRPRLGWAGEGPHFPPPVCSTVPPPVPRRSGRLPLAVASPPALAFAILAPARLPQAHALRTRRGWRNEAAEFALCCGPVDCSLFSGKSLYSRACAPRVTPGRRRV